MPSAMMSTARASGPSSPDPLEAQYKMPARQCTDCVCAFIFLATLAGMAGILAYGFGHGDPRRLTHGIDYYGRVCGLDPGVENTPWLYYCGSQMLNLTTGDPLYINLESPSCVVSCPNTSKTFTPCLTTMHTKDTPSSGGQMNTIETIITVSAQSIANVATYPSKPFGGFYCVPDMKNRTFEESLVSTGPLSGTHRILTAIGGFRRAWPLMLGAGILAIVLGYVYLKLLQTCSSIIVCVVMLVVVVIFMALGSFFLLAGGLKQLPNDAKLTYKEHNPMYGQYTPKDAMLYSVIVGIVLLVFGCCSCCFCIFRRGMSDATGPIKDACICFFDLWWLKLQPLVESITKIAVLVAGLYGLTWLITAGEVDKTGMTINKAKVKGLSRTFEYEPIVPVFIVIYVLGLIWLLEVCTAFGQFITSFSAVMWVRKSAGNWPPGIMALCKAFRAAAIYHFGSIALGSALIAICRPFYVILKCCRSRSMARITPQAYIAIVVNPQNFLKAKDIYYEISKDEPTVQELGAICFVFTVCGVMGIAGTCSYMCFVMATSFDCFVNPLSDWVVADPEAVSLATLVLTGIIAYAFMGVFDQTALAVQYTNLVGWKEEETAKLMHNYAPGASGY